MKFLTDKEFKQYLLDLDTARQEVESARASLKNTPKEVTKEYAERLADVEVKVAKLWTLLVEATPKGKDRLTSYGKVFGGKARNL